MGSITLEKLSKIYPDGTRALSDLDLVVADGELVVFVGPSGCGKTTALRMIAGLEDITSGAVKVGDKVVNTLPPKNRDMAMVFQNYALYPHMNVYDNMAFGLKMHGIDKGETDRRVRDAAQFLGLTEVLRKRPRHLSGGQRQRVAMGRAVVREPAAFLMDEPLSNLDAKLRVQMRAEIARIQRDLGVTTIYVTHDQSEAMTLGHRVCVLRHGLLQQVDRPQVLYDRPANLFVAGFIGSPAMNLVEAELVEDADGLVVTFGPHRVRLHESVRAGRSGLRGHVGRTIAFGIRPEDLEDGAVASGSAAAERITVEVDIREDMGAEVFLHFAVDAPPVKTEELAEVVGAEALEAATEQTHHHGTPFIARVDRSSQAREGDKVVLTVDTRRLHFFDLETGEAIGDEAALSAPSVAAAARA